MASCCPPNGFDAVFDDRFARRMARRYRRRGLSRTERRMVAFLREQGLEGTTVLEIGGGLGQLHLELLESGARTATSLEISTGYDREAARLLSERGLTDRVTRLRTDIAETPDEVQPADIVILHRVVCCYPDYERLLRAAGSHARRALVFSHPPRNPGSRAFMSTQNLALRIARVDYQGFAHPPDAMIRVLEGEGLRTAHRHRGPVWQVVGMTR